MSSAERRRQSMKPEVLKKTRIKNKTEWTGFLARITITLETKAMLEKTVGMSEGNISYITLDHSFKLICELGVSSATISNVGRLANW